MWSFSEDGIETAETAYALALAYANVQNDDAESMFWHYLYCILLHVINSRPKTFMPWGFRSRLLHFLFYLVTEFQLFALVQLIARKDLIPKWTSVLSEM